MCPCHGGLRSPEGVEELTPNIVALCVANGDGYCDRLDDEFAGGAYTPLRIIPPRAERVRLTNAAFCDPEVVEIRTVDTWLWDCFSPARD